ncbi:uncharacterized protein ACR2FA_000887 [Aphomia sociella]
MDVSDEDNILEYSAVVDTLINMFGDVANRDVIIAVVDNCDGDVNLSVEALMNITSENTTELGTINTIAENVMSTTETISSRKEEPHAAATIIDIPVLTGVVPTTLIGDTNIPTNQEGINSCAVNKNETCMPTERSLFNTKELINPLIPQVKAVITQQDYVTTSVSNNANIISNNKEVGSRNNLNVGPEKHSMPSTGARPKFVISPMKLTLPDKLLQIVQNHNAGYRICIIMRGVPGSGKSNLARKIVESVIGSAPNDFHTHVFSTDDYFYVRGTYKFNKNYLSEAHTWNQNRVRAATDMALSPIIIDNTNIEDWEMEPYLKYSVRNGYIIEIMEPNTPWAKKASQCARKNVHNVPLSTIQRMLDNYKNFSIDYLFRRFKLSYPDGRSPPVLRKIPIVTPSPSDSVSSQSYVSNSTVIESSSLKGQVNQRDRNKFSFVPVEMATDDKVKKTNHNKSHDILQDDVANATTSKNVGDINVLPTTSSMDLESEYINSEDMKQKMFYLEMEKKLEEIEKIEKEWDDGEGWDDNNQAKANSTMIKTENESSFEPKPQRLNYGNKPVSDDNIMKTVNECQDWSQISMFMPPWNENISNNVEKTKVSVETISSGTCIESGDTYNDKNQYREMITTSRDINLYHIFPTKEKIPQKRMLDKSSMTNEQLLMESYRCEYEEKHFSAFRKMFKHLPRGALRDIFDKCQGDVNWAVGIVIDDVENNRLQVLDTDNLSDNDDTVEECGCMAAYNIIPDTKMSKFVSTSISQTSVSVDSQKQRKSKKEVSNSDSILELKRQIEQNVVISENHYSEHCLKVRKWRRGEINNADNLGTTSEELDNAQAMTSSFAPFVANETLISSNPSTNLEYSDDEESSTSTEEPERFVKINVGMKFLSKLDDLFGRKGMTYPQNVVPKLSIPMSLLNEINALWMESLMHQLDDNEKQSHLMVMQDEEFARELAMKEDEMAEAGKEPVVPDLKEIMDMDFALSLYQKDVVDWRNKEPNDWAAKLSREKLYNLFPDLSQDVLSELLMAHDNNFQVTVEVLLISTGKSDIVAEENGVAKYVMKKEMERQEKILEEERKTLSEVEWPLLPKSEVVDMSIVNNYRDEAEKHLARRNMNYQKAQDYIRRGMTQVANYFSDVAAFHKLKYEQANSLAAASLMQVHASNNPDNATIDLHFLRVAEAKEALDLFLDKHIYKLKEILAQNKQGPKSQTLFFITGRGLHSSNGLPRVKPAVKKRLQDRGLDCIERNPGLLSANVTAYDKLSHEVQFP